MYDIFNRYYKKYDAWYDKHPFQYASEIRALKNVIHEKGKGLEIGVGTGRFASGMGISFGIDPSVKMLEVTRSRGILVTQAEGEHIPFHDNVFDYVLMAATLCFVRNPGKVLIETHRVLQKGGDIIIGMIDKNSSAGRMYQSKKSIFYANAHFFSVSEVLEFLKQSKFDVCNIIQTLVQLKLTKIEEPMTGYGKGSFVVIRAKKDGTF